MLRCFLENRVNEFVHRMIHRSRYSNVYRSLEMDICFSNPFCFSMYDNTDSVVAIYTAIYSISNSVVAVAAAVAAVISDENQDPSSVYDGVAFVGTTIVSSRNVACGIILP